MNIYEDLIQFLKKPVPEKDPNRDFFHHVVIFLILLMTCFMISFFLNILIGMVYNSGLIENDYHALDELQKQSTKEILFALVVFAPLVEETIFRAPITIFQSPWKLPFKIEGVNKIRIKAFENPMVFRTAFYGFALAFGYVHLLNYQVDSQILLYSPLLVAPQISLGLIIGYIRVRLGFFWAIAMHAAYNGILAFLFLATKDVLPQ